MLRLATKPRPLVSQMGLVVVLDLENRVEGMRKAPTGRIGRLLSTGNALPVVLCVITVTKKDMQDQIAQRGSPKPKDTVVSLGQRSRNRGLWVGCRLSQC